MRVMQSPARRPRCGAPRLRATRRRATDAWRRSLRARSFRLMRHASAAACLAVADASARCTRRIACPPPEPRCARHPTPRSTRRAVWMRVHAFRFIAMLSVPISGRDRLHRCVSKELRRSACHARVDRGHTARRLGGRRGAARSARQGGGRTRGARVAGRVAITARHDAPRVQHASQKSAGPQGTLRAE